jgi:hypothetical protein
MTKQKAIYLKCIDCSGGDRKDVLFCSLSECSLWEYRCGCHISSVKYRAKIERGWESHRKIAEELQRDGLDMAFFLRGAQQARVISSNSQEKVKDRGDKVSQGEVGFVSESKAGCF